MLDKWVYGIGKCENSDTSKNKYGLMCYNGRPRHLCVMSDEDAKNEVKRRLLAYERSTLRDAMYRYSPKGENNTEAHIACIEQHSGVSANLKF